MNKLVCIGYLGGFECYLNVSESEARERFAKEHYGDGEIADPDDYNLKVFEFTDHFCAYDVWPAGDL